MRRSGPALAALNMVRAFARMLQPSSRPDAALRVKTYEARPRRPAWRKRAVPSGSGSVRAIGVEQDPLSEPERPGDYQGSMRACVAIRSEYRGGRGVGLLSD
jgi:hypothetical protein